MALSNKTRGKLRVLRSELEVRAGVVGRILDPSSLSTAVDVQHNPGPQGWVTVQRYVAPEVLLQLSGDPLRPVYMIIGETGEVVSLIGDESFSWVRKFLLETETSTADAAVDSLQQRVSSLTNPQRRGEAQRLLTRLVQLLKLT
jgi:hypothetical protein